MNVNLININYIPTENEEEFLYKLRKNKVLDLSNLSSNECDIVAHLAQDIGIIYVDGDNVLFNQDYVSVDALFDELWNICPERSRQRDDCIKLFNGARISGYPARLIIDARRKYVEETIKNSTDTPRYQYVKNLYDWLCNERYRIDDAEKISFEEVANNVEKFENE